MWQKGFKNTMLEILGNFGNKVELTNKKGEFFSLSTDGNIITVELEKDFNYSQDFTFEELFDLIVPNKRDMSFYTLMSDVTFELTCEDPSEVMIRKQLNKFMSFLANFFEQKNKNSVQVVPGYFFEVEGVTYEQLAVVCA